MMDLEVIKEKLIKEREELKLLLESIEKETEEVLKETSSAADELANKYEYQQEEHLKKDFILERLKKIEKALEKIKKGNYGICEKCNKPIEETRLKIDLAVETCRKCL